MLCQLFAGLTLLIELLLQRLLEMYLSIEIAAELACFQLCCRRSLLPSSLQARQLCRELADLRKQLRLKLALTFSLFLVLTLKLSERCLHSLQATCELRELPIHRCIQAKHGRLQFLKGPQIAALRYATCLRTCSVSSSLLFRKVSSA